MPEQATQAADDAEQDADAAADPATDPDDLDADLSAEDRADGADIFGDVDPDDLDADLDPDTTTDSESSTTDATSDDTDTDDADPVDAASDPDADVPEVSIGNVYCRGLGVMSALAIDRCSEDDDRDREELIEEYSGLAEQMEIDQYVDSALEARGGIDSMGPGQAALVMTGVMVVTMVVMEPGVQDRVADGIDFELPSDLDFEL